MCGILGGFLTNNTSFEIKIIKKNLDLLFKRGPDSKKMDIRNFNIGNFILGHTRLSIIDISQDANQPMYSKNRRYGLIFNGVILNYVELKNELRKKGRKFLTNSDTEVLLNAWDEWQEETISKLDGMFAFGIFDFINSTITIVRDRYGIKPIFYYSYNNEFLFSSDISVLKKLNFSKNELNWKRTYDYLEYGKYDFEGQTFFSNIFNLKPGHLIKINVLKNKISDQLKWSNVTNKLNKISYQDAVHLTKELFLNSIQKNLRSDVPVAAALSGGIDSSAIVCAIKYLEPDYKMNTFSFIDSNQKISEEKWIDIINAFTGFKNNKVVINSDKLNNDFDNLLLAQGEPFGGPSIYAQYVVYNYINKRGIKVCLDGQGADEVIGGYNGFPGLRLHSLLEQKKYNSALNFLNSSSNFCNNSKIDSLKRLLDSLTSGKVNYFLKKINNLGENFQYIDHRVLKEKGVQLDTPNNFKTVAYKDRRMTEFLKHSISTFGLQSLLRHGDRNSMQFSIESRVPFLSNEFVNHMLSLPENYLVSDLGEPKYIFKDAMNGIVPKEILLRKDKIGFEVSGEQFLFSLKENINDWFNNEINLPFLNIKNIKEDLELFFLKKKKFSYKMWRIINFYRWHQLNF